MILGGIMMFVMLISFVMTCRNNGKAKKEGQIDDDNGSSSEANVHN